MGKKRSRKSRIIKNITYSGSALQNKILVASSLFADHLPHPAHNQDKRIKMPGWELSVPLEGHPAKGKIIGGKFTFCSLFSLQTIHKKRHTRSRVKDFHSQNGIKTGDSGIKHGEK
jgi:hypothetical protein